MSTELCKCPTCLASRSASTIPAPRDLASAIREKRNDTPSAEERQLRVVEALTPAAVTTAKE